MRLPERLPRLRSACNVPAGPFLVVALLLAVGCVEGPTTPPRERAAASIAGAVGTVRVGGVLRATPLAADLVARATIGPAGGVLTLPASGFELTVPAGAVAAPTVFQVRALAGRLLAYEFEPHGTTFPVAPTFTQQLKAVDLRSIASVTSPVLGYFTSAAQLDQAGAAADVAELRPAAPITDIAGGRVRGEIWHFSGYMVSSGRR